MLGGGINILALIVGAVTMYVGVGIIIVAGFGLIQFAWILPMFFRYKKRQQIETAKGLLVAAGISVLLSAGCWGMLSNQSFH